MPDGVRLDTTSSKGESTLSNHAKSLEHQLDVLASAAGATLAQDPTGRIVYANDAAARALGFPSASQLVESSVEEVLQRVAIFDERGAPLPLERLPGSRVLAGEAGVRQVVRYRVAATGEEGWARLKATPVLDAEGTLSFVVTAFYDISDEKRTERELQARAREQEAVVELGRRALASGDLDDLFSTAAQLAARTLDVSHCYILEAVGRDELAVRAQTGWDDRVMEERTLPAGPQSVAGYTLLEQEAVLVEDVDTDARFNPDPLELGLVSGICLPISAKDSRFGVIGAFSKRRRGFAPQQVNFLVTVANVLAEAIQSKTSQEVHAELLALERAARAEAERVAARLHAIQKMTDAALAHLSLDDLLHELLARIKALLRVDTVAILLPCDDAPDQLYVRAALGLEEELSEPQRIPLGHGAAGRIAATRRPLSVEDVSESEPISKALRDKGVASLAGVPLLVEGEAIGVIHVGSLTPRRFQPEEVSLLQLVADRAASAIDRARLYEQERAERVIAERRQERLAYLARASQLLSQSFDYAQTLAELARLAVPRLADWCAVQIVENGEIRTLEVAHVDPSKVELAWELHKRYPVNPDARLGAPNVIRTGEAELYAEISDELLEAAARDEEHLEILKGLGLRSAMVVPLTARGQTFGAITFVAAESGARYGPEDLDFASDLARRAALAIDNARLFVGVQETEERFRNLVQTLGAIFWEADPKTMQFTFVSKRAEEILGYPSESWKQPGFWPSILHPEDRDAALELATAAAEDGRDHEFEYRALSAAGEVRWLKNIVHVTRDPAGRARHLRGVMVDMTEQKEVEQILEESKERYAHLARTLQRALLPPDLPDIPGFEIEARYRPAGEGNEVGGDFYDVFEIAGGGRAIVIGDVCGKGPRAATLTGLARHTIRAAAPYEDAPSQVLRVLNETIERESSDTQFATVALAWLHPEQNGARLKLASGGHPLPILLKPDGSVRRVGTPGTLLGVVPDPELIDEEIEITPGDVLVFYTDGVTVERGPDIEPSWLPNLLRGCARLSAAEIADEIERAVIEFLPGEPRDDIALLVLQIPPE